jgi:predicted small lipoprotein YifL
MIRILACLAMLAAVPACGLKGDLEQPGPLWGDKSRPKPAAPDPNLDTPEDEYELFRNRRRAEEAEQADVEEPAESDEDAR